jgi:hypothetical protein
MITNAKITQIDNEFVVSEEGVWVEGIYASKHAALAALTLDPEVLARLWAKHKPEPLTQEQVASAA